MVMAVDSTLTYNGIDIRKGGFAYEQYLNDPPRGGGLISIRGLKRSLPAFYILAAGFASSISMGYWRSWERASMALKRSWVRIPYAPFDNSIKGDLDESNTFSKGV